MKWTKEEKSFVESLRVARVATVDEHGVPHNVPICPLLEGGRIYFGTGADSKKIRNIRSHPEVAITFDEYTDAWSHLRGIMIQGEARVVGRQEFRRMRKQLYTKYLGYESDSPLKEGEAVIVEIEPQKKFSWGLQE